MWGQQHESDALEAYRLTLDSSCTVNQVGVCISDCGYLGASPDGVVKDSNEDPIRLIEVKCPYKARNKSIEEMYSDPSFCVSLEDGKPMLKTDHDYYFQVQGQMAVTGIHICDFVVWTPTNFITIKVEFDETFWKTKCVPFLTITFTSTLCCRKSFILNTQNSQVSLYSP